MRMEVFWTVFAGVTVFVVGQIFVKFFIEPIHRFHEYTGEIADSLIYYANIYSNPGMAREELLKEAHDTFRRHSGKLLARIHAIRGYRFWARLRILPKRENAAKAGGYLIRLANGVYDKSMTASDYNTKRRREIEQLLNIETGE